MRIEKTGRAEAIKNNRCVNAYWKKIKGLRTGEAQLFYSRLVSDFASGEETRRTAGNRQKQNRERK